MENTVYFNNPKETILLSSLNNFLANVNDLYRDSSSGKNNLDFIIQFIERITDELQRTDGNASFKRYSENDFRDVIDYKWNVLLNKSLQHYEQIKHDIQTKTSRKNQIEHYFDIVDRQLQFDMKKKIIKSEVIIAAALKEHEHKMTNLKIESKNILSEIELTTKNNLVERNNQIIKRNKLETRKTRIVHVYDSEMINKYKNVIELDSKIEVFENNICQLQELISRQMPFYNEVIIEKENENNRFWHEKLYAIQRKIAARKIQMHFRRYLNYIKTRDAKKNKKGQHKNSNRK